jgi:hypothetical protein
MKKRTPHRNKYQRGQALIIIALSFVALLAFVGLAVDVGSLYVTYTQLKRAVDAAAVAAANNIKYPQASEAERKEKITEAAREMLAFHDVKDVASLNVYLCSDSGLPPDFDAMCPDPPDMPRKLAYVEATQNSPVYFLRLFGVHSIPFTTNAVGEAATVDMVLVFDTSESMGDATAGYDPRNFNPGACNAANNCHPLREAKDAAKDLISLLFDGYDQVSIVTFDYKAHVQFALSTDIRIDHNGDGEIALDAVDDFVNLHDDAPAAKLPWTSISPNGGYRVFNPIWPEDRDGDGQDADPAKPCTDVMINNTDPMDPNNLIPDLWDDNSGEPCDIDNMPDTYDWNGNGVHYIKDPFTGQITPDDDHYFTHTGTWEDTSLLSTCSGCGIRTGTNVLTSFGRPNSVWVMVFLSDGVANLSDFHSSNPTIPASFTYGFCGDNPPTSFWSSYCIDKNKDYGPMNSIGRRCIDSDAGECPSDDDHTNWTFNAAHTTDSGPYSVEDYAFDMIDSAALLESDNPNEPKGENIIIYSIGLGSASAGETLLRYMANIGDDGSRANDLCAGVAALHPCGNYYYAPDVSYLNQVFESIANRIFTKISR